MNKLAVVFAGQGSQYQGMGQDFLRGQTYMIKPVDCLVMMLKL